MSELDEVLSEGAAFAAAELVGKWIYVRSGWRRESRVIRHFVQAQRGGVVLELADSERGTSYPLRQVLASLRIEAVQTLEEEQASRPVGDRRSEDGRRMDQLAQLHRSGDLPGWVRRLPMPHVEPDLRRAIDAVAAPP